MDKNRRIQKLTKQFIDKYGSTNILVCDNWDADLCAIGLTDKTKKYLIYISNYNKPKDTYFVSLENPPVGDEELYSDAGEFDNLTIEEVEKILVTHLKLTTN